LGLKDNHPTLSEAVTLFLNEARATGCAAITHSYYETVEGDHGRIETRRYGLTSEMEWRGAIASWPNLQSVGMVESRREIGDTVQIDTRYFLTSLPAHGVRFAQAVWQHWCIENSLHWSLDVSFDEDACRIRKDKGAQTFWDHAYLVQVLTG
jgi:predicted transposase YbfD/YdcC